MNILAGNPLVLCAGIEPGQRLIQPQRLHPQVIETQSRGRQHDQRNWDNRLLLKTAGPRCPLFTFHVPGSTFHVPCQQSTVNR